VVLVVNILICQYFGHDEINTDIPLLRLKSEKHF